MDKRMKIAEARRLRAFIEQNADLLTDDAAVNMPTAFPLWKTNTAYTVGARVRYNDTLYKCVNDHQSQDTWTPAEAPSLWAEVLAGQDGTDIGDWVQPDSTNPYSKGDKVNHNGHTWTSVIDNNVWEPGVYGWEII